MRPLLSDDDVFRIVYAVVCRAVDDWNSAVDKVAANTVERRDWSRLTEIRTFLKSDWCDLLLFRFCVNGECILKILEADLASAKKERLRLIQLDELGVPKLHPDRESQFTPRAKRSKNTLAAVKNEWIRIFGGEVVDED